MNFRERKAERSKHYNEWIHGWRLIVCNACNGSGHYDTNGSPPCEWCDGTGKERVSPEQYEQIKREENEASRNYQENRPR